MRINRLRRSFVAATVASLALATGQASAADPYPNKPVRIVVPYSPGGTDAVTRQLAQRLTEIVGQTFFVDNRPGADGTIGAGVVARAQPDGSTLLVASGIPLLLAPTVHKNLPYEAARDLVPVAVFSSVPMVVVASPTIGVSSMKELIAYARKNPGKLAYGGSEQMTYLGMEMILRGTGAEMTYVLQGCGSRAHRSAWRQHPVRLSTVAASLPHLKDGKLRPLAVSTSQRSASLPEVPTVAESVLPGYELNAWFAVMAPAGMPPAIIEALSNHIGTAMRTPETRQKFETMGSDVLYLGHREAREFFAAENARWNKAYAEANSRADSKQR